MPVISADSHVQEPPELYGERLDARYRERAPRIEERDGMTYFVVDGKRPRRVDLAARRIDEDDRNRESSATIPAAGATSNAALPTRLWTASAPR